MLYEVITDQRPGGDPDRDGAWRRLYGAGRAGMKVRHRITLWVSLVGLISSVLLSLIVFFWGLDSPYEFLDQELEIRAHSVLDELKREHPAVLGIDRARLNNFTHLYWMRIYAEDGSLVSYNFV